MFWELFDMTKFFCAKKLSPQNAVGRGFVIRVSCANLLLYEFLYCGATVVEGGAQ